MLSLLTLRHFFFGVHLTLAASFAISDRRFLLSFAPRLTPFDAPSLDSATAAGFRVSGWGGSGGSRDSPLSSSPMICSGFSRAISAVSRRVFFFCACPCEHSGRRPHQRPNDSNATSTPSPSRCPPTSLLLLGSAPLRGGPGLALRWGLIQQRLDLRRWLVDFRLAVCNGLAPDPRTDAGHWLPSRRGPISPHNHPDTGFGRAPWSSSRPVLDAPATGMLL